MHIEQVAIDRVQQALNAEDGSALSDLAKICGREMARVRFSLLNPIRSALEDLKSETQSTQIGTTLVELRELISAYCQLLTQPTFEDAELLAIKNVTPKSLESFSTNSTLKYLRHIIRADVSESYDTVDALDPDLSTSAESMYADLIEAHADQIAHQHTYPIAQRVFEETYAFRIACLYILDPDVRSSFLDYLYDTTEDSQDYGRVPMQFQRLLSHGIVKIRDSQSSDDECFEITDFGRSTLSCYLAENPNAIEINEPFGLSGGVKAINSVSSFTSAPLRVEKAAALHLPPTSVILKEIGWNRIA